MSGMSNGIPILSLLTALPVVGAVIVLLSGKHARAVAMITALAATAVALVVWTDLPSNGTIGLLEQHPWVPSLGIEYHLGVDGLGALMVVLSALVTLMSLDAAKRVHHQPNLYFSLVLVLESCLFGTFTALNFFHWFLFWELSLIPAFFLTVQALGRSEARTGRDAVLCCVHDGRIGGRFCWRSWPCFFRPAAWISDNTSACSPRPAKLRSRGCKRSLSAFWPRDGCGWRPGVLVGFAVKVPLMPFHTWLPNAYSEAPSPVTMLLTGTMSKMGVYGLLRIALPMFGPEIARMRTPLLVLAVTTVVMGAWAAAAQKDLKRVFAYSSVNHLGYCQLGIFALAVPATDAAMQTSQAAALNGVILQMFNHGITAAALFWFIAMLQERSGGIRGIDDFGGLRKPAPVFAGLMGIVLFSSLGLPGLNGFVGEFLIFRGVFPLAWVSATVSVLGLLVTAAVILTVIQKVFTGPVPERWAAFPDMHTGERMAMAPVIGLMLLIGLVPQLIVDSVNPTVMNLLAHWRF